MSRTFARLVLVVTGLFLAVFFVWPLWQILAGGFIDANGRATLAYLTALLANPLYRTGLANSLGLACATTALALALAVPLAFAADRWDFPGKSAFGSLVLLPLILPPFVGAIGIRQIFGRYGALNALVVALHLRPAGWTFDWIAAHQFGGVAIVDALSLYPLIYLNAIAALANVDPSLDEAAENLGCVGWRRFRRVTLPLIKPGLFAGGTLVFIWAFTDLATPLIFDFDRVTSVQIYYGLREVGGNPFPYALVALMLAACVLLYAVGKGLFGRFGAAGASKAAGARRTRKLSRTPAWLCTAAFAAVTFLALLPHLGVLLVAFAKTWYHTVLPAQLSLDNFGAALGNALTVPAIANSLKFAGASAIIDLLLGAAIAYVIVRTDVRGRQVLDFLAMLPLAVPGLVLAFGYLAMAQDGRFFAFLNPVRNPTILLIVAYSIRRLSYVVRSAVSGLQQTPPAFEEAAQNLGATPSRALRRITLPLISAHLIAGTLIAFAFALLEVSDSLILAQKQAYYPITKAILELFQLLGDGKFIASALGVWAMAFLGTALIGLSLLLGKRLGAMFRV
ncbi:MAG TPA: iron ABC transporter permease [Opitutaceae bacterium]|jgi:iron(III) transport system permease protein